MSRSSELSCVTTNKCTQNFCLTIIVVKMLQIWAIPWVNFILYQIRGTVYFIALGTCKHTSGVLHLEELGCASTGCINCCYLVICMPQLLGYNTYSLAFTCCMADTVPSFTHRAAPVLYKQYSTAYHADFLVVVLIVISPWSGPPPPH